MRPVIVFVVVGVSLLMGGAGSSAQAVAAEDSKDLPAAPAAAAQAGITRVAIAVSGGPVAYTDQFRQSPPAIVIEFRSRNIRTQLEPLVVVNSGVMKEIQSDYYPKDRRALKRLTLTLVQPAAYTIAQQANQIVVDIETPASALPGRMAVGRGVTVLGIEAKETLMQRLKVMEGALRQAGPQRTPVASKPKPVVVTKPVEIPKLVFQPEPTGEPVSKGGRGGFWPGVLLGIGGTWIAVIGRGRRRKAVVSPRGPAEVVPMAPTAVGASVYEQLMLKAVQRQGQKLISSKAIEGLGAIWIVEKDGARYGVLCLTNGEFFERKVLEQFMVALKQETLPSGTVMALGAFTAPAQAFAKECGIALVAREEVLRMINAELKGSVLEPEAAAAGLARLEGELAQAQERIRHVEQELAAQKKQGEEAEWFLGEERTKKQALEQQVAQLTRELAEKVELYAKLSQEADQLKAKSAEVDERLTAEQEQRTQLETQIAQLIQESTEAAKDTIKAVGQEHRKWPRFDLSSRKGKGILVRATSNDGEPMNGDARNLSAGGLCVELPSSEALADEFEVKLFLPDRTKPIEAIGKLMWKGRGSRRRMGQLGVAFSAINAPDQEAIKQFVEERKPEPVSVG